MPFDRNADLPKEVREALPAAAQTIWRKAFNAALEEDHDEGRAAAIAWSAVKAAGYRKNDEGRWVQMNQDEGRILFLQDLEAGFQVRYTKTPEGRHLIQGLPLLRAGTWNGFQFDEQHMQEIEANFEKMQTELAWEPPLRTKHVAEDGIVDTRQDVLGYQMGCYLDGGVLKGDFEVFDDSTVLGLQRRRYRYISPEIRVNRTEHDGHTRLLGTAFVDNPAIKAMPWRLVLNREEFPDLQMQAEKGGNPMSFMERLKELVGKGEVKPEQVRQLMAEEDKASGQAPDPAKDDSTPPPASELAALRQENRIVQDQVQQLNKQLEQEREAVQLQQRAAKASTTTQTLLSERFITPGMQERLERVLVVLADQTTTLKLSDGQEQTLNLFDELVALLRERGAVGEVYFTQLSQGEGSELQGDALDKKLSRMAATVSPPRSATEEVKT